jgi:hypothetical protein
MRNKAILFGSFLLVSSSVFAEQGLLEGVAKQAAKDTATVVAPDAVKKGRVCQPNAGKCQKFKKGVENAPDAVKDQLKETLKESVEKKVDQATPEETKKAVEVLKAGKEKVESAPKSTKAVKSKVKAKAAEKALDLLR